MRWILRVTLLAAVSVPLLGQSQRPGVSIPAAPTSVDGTIRGRVTAADTNRPLGGARIRLTSPTLTAARVAVADATGVFEFKNLKPDRYTLSASIEGFLTLSYGQTRPFESGKPLTLSQGQVVENANLALPRGGAIAGTVVAESNRPVIDATVIAFRPQYVQGARRLVEIASVKTDDRGQFRIFGLSPGSFVLSAGKGSGLAPRGISEPPPIGYATTFLPGVRREDQAVPIAVRLGQTTGDVTLSLPIVRMGSISGAVTGLEWQQQGVRAVSVREIGRVRSSIVTASASGTFNFIGLAPGDYELVAHNIAVGTATAPFTNPQMAMARVTLDGDALKNVDLVATRLPLATGRVVVSSSDGAVPLTGIRLRTIPTDPAIVRPLDPALIRPSADSSFALAAPPGRVLIRPTLPAGWVLKAVRLRGEDVTNTGIDLELGKDVNDIEVEVSKPLTLVSGGVRGARSEAISQYSVVFFPRNRGRLLDDGRSFAVARPDQNNRFEVNTLAPGEYYAAAVEYVDPSQAQDPGFLDRLERDATLFSLLEHEPKSLELRLIPGVAQ